MPIYMSGNSLFIKYILVLRYFIVTNILLNIDLRDLSLFLELKKYTFIKSEQLMKITDYVFLVGSGHIGLSHSLDCSVYLIDGGTELALIDSGAGLEIEKIFSNIKKHGFNLNDIKKVILTHAHADHAGGCKTMKKILDCNIFVPEAEVNLLEGGSEERVGINIAKNSGIYPPDYLFPYIASDVAVSNGNHIQVGKFQIEAIHVPDIVRDQLAIF